MWRKALFLVVVASSLLASKGEAAVIYSTWDGGGDGHSWADRLNWNPNIVPDNNATLTFAVSINGPSDGKTDVCLLHTRAIDQLECYDNVWLMGSTPNDICLTLEGPNGFSNQGNIRVMGRFDDAHHFRINGILRNESHATLELFRATIETQFHNAVEATLLVSYGTDFPSGASNDGAIVIYPLGEMSADANMTNAGQIRVLGGLCASTALFLNDVNGIIHGFGVMHSQQQTQNKGAIYASAGSLVVHTDSSLVNTGTLGNETAAFLHVRPMTDVNNQGMIEVNVGGAVTFDCNLVNEPNAAISLRGGTLAATTITQQPDASFAGFGSITGDVVIDPNALIQLTGPTIIVDDVAIDPNATLEISDGTTLITGHTTCNNGIIHIKGGRIIPQGGLTNNGCNIIWEPGTYNNVADFNLDGLVNFIDFADFADTWLWLSAWR
ncbi:MAG: hypothetical protein ACYTEQ_16525 [Planctomycetota bacterium]